MEELKEKLISCGHGVTHKELECASKGTSIQDFHFIKALSRGAYGRVFLAQRKITKDLYAIKVLRKKEVVTDRQRRNILMEVLC
jgi:serine/threonine protein kinase